MRFRFVAISLGVLALSGCGEPTDKPAPAGAESLDVATKVEAQSPQEGARPNSFAQCAVCHNVDPGGNGIGPTLAGVYEAKAGHIGDFAYSSAMRESGLTWDEGTLDRYLENPRKTVPGTKMSYAGMRDAEKRAALIAYLKTL